MIVFLSNIFIIIIIIYFFISKLYINQVNIILFLFNIFIIIIIIYYFISKVWINQGDIILISLRDYQDAKADVILKYTTEEARNLKAYGELPENGILFFYFGIFEF